MQEYYVRHVTSKIRDENYTISRIILYVHICAFSLPYGEVHSRRENTEILNPIAIVVSQRFKISVRIKVGV